MKTRLPAGASGLCLLVAVVAHGADAADDAGDPARDWSPELQEYVAAQQALPPHPDALRIRALAQATLDDPVFGASADAVGWRWEWRFEHQPEPEPEPRELPALLAALLAALPDALGLAGHVVLWLLLLVLLGWLWRSRHRVRWTAAGTGRKAAAALPATALAPLLRPDAPPEDVLDAARKLWRCEARRAALALLYRAALLRLGERHGSTIPASGTELECLRRITSRVSPANARAFEILVRHWMRCAYAGEVPAALDPLESAYLAAVDDMAIDAAVAPDPTPAGSLP